ncbi:MAG: hypothetical protein BMS9Abin05_1565 [Rhodothermia bacterium]|nr:MAG: hypothetical protein BMS9Abin05_1565 [Rhodothermia bacterium]
MITRDYILRQVQQMVEALAQVSLKRQAQEYHIAQDILAQTIQEITGTDSERVRNMSIGELLRVCRLDTEFSSDKAVGLADLLREDGFVQDALGNQEVAKESWKRSIWLYEAVSESGGIVPIDLDYRLTQLYSLLQTGP